MTRPAALVLTLLTGFSGLVYEVAWQKYLATLLGSHSEATAAVLAIFLGGLSAGYALFGRVTRSLVARARASGAPLELLRFYGGIEAAIGAYALVFPWLFGLAQALSVLAPASLAGVAFAFDVLLSALLIGPPAVLMGGTIPILTLALARELDEATRVHALVYGSNTAGAFAGALAATFFLVPWLGLDGVLYAMACVNLLAGASFALLGRFGARIEPHLEAAGAATAPERVEGFAGLVAVAVLAGFAMMTLQTVLNRIGALSFGASQFTFGMVVAVFVLSIALGSFAVSALTRIPAALIVGSQWLLVYLLVVLYRLVPDATYYAHALRTLFRSVEWAFYPYWFLVFSALLAILLVPIGLSGALLPLLFHHMRRTVGDLGAVAGRLYSWNTVGSLLGALFGGYVLLFWLELDQVYAVALAALIAGLAILTPLLLRVPKLPTALIVGVPGVFFLWNLPGWSPDRLNAGIFRERDPLPVSYKGPEAFFQRYPQEVIFARDGPNASATVREGPRRDGRLNRSIITNGKSDGHLITDYTTMAMCGLLPAFLAERPERAFVIGFGTGVSAGELAALDQVREVRVAEISQSVLDAAPLFEEGNQHVLASPKVELIRSDAYRALLRDEGRYDVIVSEPSNPWVTGVEMLYSLEFLQAARARLAPGGVFAQWFHLYELDQPSVDLVLRTYAKAFPHVSVWFTISTDLLLVGFDHDQMATDAPALARRFARPDFRAGFERAGIPDLAALLAHEMLPIDTLRAGELSGELHTLRHPRLSYLAGRAFFLNQLAGLPPLLDPGHIAHGESRSLLRLAAGGGPLPEPMLESVVRETCRLERLNECATFLAYWSAAYPGSDRYHEVLELVRGERPRIPTALRDETLEQISRLYGVEGPIAGGTPLQQARQLTSWYLNHYHYAIPFDRDVLADVWRRCEGRACDAARRRTEDRIGSLTPGAAPASAVGQPSAAKAGGAGT